MTRLPRRQRRPSTIALARPAIARPVTARLTVAGLVAAALAIAALTVAALGTPWARSPKTTAANPGPPPSPESGSAPDFSTIQEFGNAPYDARYTFVRVRFSTSGRGGFGRGGSGRGFGGRQPPWAHDFPHADRNFVKILNEVTLSNPNDGTNVIDADSPDLHRYPVAYVAEPGVWAPTHAELDNISAYLQKGGFLILDDFRGQWEWQNVQEIFNEVFPGQPFRLLTLDDPIFNAFFKIETLDFSPPTFRQYKPYFLGIHEDDDPSKRLQVVANLNNDIGDYWEYSDLGYYPIDLSNEAYKVGVNYVIYALTR